MPAPNNPYWLFGVRLLVKTKVALGGPSATMMLSLWKAVLWSITTSAVPERTTKSLPSPPHLAASTSSKRFPLIRRGIAWSYSFNAGNHRLP